MENSVSFSRQILATCWRPAALILTSLAFGAPAHSQQAPRIWLQEAKPQAATFMAGGSEAAAAALRAGTSSAQHDAVALLLASGQAQPLAMVKGDFDEDGIEDLAVGYRTALGGALALFQGNLDAFAPQSKASWLAIAGGRFPSPFLSEARVIELPEAPDFLLAGNFSGSGHLDIAAGARGSSTLYIIAGDGKGGFLPPQAIRLSGGLTALGSAQLEPNTPLSHIVAGTTGQAGSQLTVFENTNRGITPIATIPLRGPAASVAFGNLTGDPFPDVAVVAAGELLIVHGRDVHSARMGAGSSSLQAETVLIPRAAASVTLGAFIPDRASRQQMAVLATDGTLHIVARAHLDTRPWSLPELQLRRRAQLNRKPDPLAIPVDPSEGWQVAESIPAGVSPAGPSQPPVLFRTQISSHPADDVMILDSGQAQMHVFSHESMPPAGAAAGSLPASFHSTMAISQSQRVVAAIPMRVNIDGRPGVVFLKQGQMAPAVMMPLPDPTFFPNRFDDIPPRGTGATCLNLLAVDASGDCTLREAILKANSTAGTDNIMLQAGTYTLSLPRVAMDFTGLHGTLEVTDSLNIVGMTDGTGNPASIVQGGIDLSSSVDKVFSFNQDISVFTNASVSISNLVIQNGHNRGDETVFDGLGGAFDFDTGAAPATATLSVTNCNITNNTLTEGEGGGFAIFNTNNGTGFATITNSTIQNNTVAPTSAGVAGNGGGIFVGTPATIVMNNSKVLNNSATANGGINPVGGGLEIVGPSGTAGQNAIHGSTISKNQAAGDGGGIWNTSNLLIDTNSLISNNTAGGNGGGLWHNVLGTDTAVLSKVTLTGNTATGNGGAISAGNLSGGASLTVQFSRLAGNTAAAGSNLNNVDCTVKATNNWWGTNTPGATISDTTTTTAFDPFIVLTLTANPAKIRINQSSMLTADMSKDNHGSGAALAGNLDVLNALSITFHNPILGTIPELQPEALSAGAQATATFNAGTLGGNGSAAATVDQQTVTAPIIVLQPPSITKTFASATVAVAAPNTLTFSITNGNTVAIDASFTDTLPANLVVATIPSVANGCGGTVTATAGSGSITFANAALPVGTCAITVNVQGTSDGAFTNNVTIDSSDAGNGNTSSANLTVINPPTIAKAFGAATIPLNGTTSLTFILTSTNAGLTLTGVAFNDLLPAGLVVATPSNLASTCNGTALSSIVNPGRPPIPGPPPGSISLSGATLAPGSSCTVSANVTGTTAGVKNNSVVVTSTNGGTGNTSNATVTVVAPPTVSKSFAPSSVALNSNSTLSFALTNPNTASALSGVAFTDNLPIGVVVATPSSIIGGCGSGTVTATAGSGTITFSGGTLTASPAAGSTCTFSVSVTGTTPGAKSNTTTVVTSTEGGTGATSNTAILTVEAPPGIAKAFNPTTIPLNGTTTLTFTLTNPAANAAAQAGVAFTDSLPVGLAVATPNGLTNTCGGTATALAGSGSVSLIGGAIPINANCALTVNIIGTAGGSYTNTTGAVSSTNGGTGLTASATLTVAAPPNIVKSFNPTSIPVNSSSTLTFLITNPNSSIPLTGIGFTDTLPAGVLVNAAPVGTCGTGTVTAPIEGSTITLAGGTLAASPAPGSSCTFSVSVFAISAGVKNNAVSVTSTEGGPGNTSNATLTVVAPPTFTKSFAPASVAVNGSSTLSFTITNPNGSALSGVTFTDTLPPGVVVATVPTITGTCGSGTVTAAAGSGTIILSGGTLFPNPLPGSTCTFSVSVTGTTPGDKNNTAGRITSTEGGTGATSNTALLTVVAPPSIAKAFGAASISLNGTTSLTFTLTNPAANTAAQAGVAFTDSLPVGLVVATPNGLTNTCGGTATALAGSGSVSLIGGAIPINANCALTVNIIGTAGGSYTNTTGAVSSTNGGTGLTASATLTVAAPPNIVKSFNPTSIPVNSSSTLTFLITNPNSSIPLTGIGFTDTLPAGVLVNAAPVGTCGTGTVTAPIEGSTITLAGGTLAPGSSCTFSVSVFAISAGVKDNAVSVTSTEGGPGNTSNATLTVVAPPTFTKSFAPASVAVNGSSTLSFTITNPNASALSGIAFSDGLPPGVVVSTVPAIAGTCGTITAVAGSSSISLAGGTLTASPAAGSTCTFSVSVTGTTPGDKNNTAGRITSTEGGTGATSNTALLTVVAPPSIAKAFGAANISLNGTTSLTFTLTNPAANTVAQVGVAFTDTLPVGLVVSTPNGLSSTCGGAPIAAAGSGSISLTAGNIAPNSSCILIVNVTGNASGNYTNTTSTVSSTNGGTGNTATANLSVAAPPTVTKAFGAATILLNGSTSLTFVIANPNTSPISGVALTDNLPAGLVVSTPNGLTGSCGAGTLTALSNSGSIVLSGGTLAASATCTFSVNVTGTAPGVLANTTGPVSSTESGPGAVSNTATLTVLSPPSISKAFGAASIQLGSNTSLTFTITNPNATVGLTGLAVTDALPSGLVVTLNSLAGTCGAGTINATATTITLTGGTIPASGTCTFAANVTAIGGGTQVNTTTPVTSTNAGIGNTATATLTVLVPDLTISKTHIGNFKQGQTGAVYTIIVSNSGAAPTSGTVTVTDTLPTSLAATMFAGAGWTCTLSPLSCTRADTLAIAGAYPALTLTVNVSGVAPASATNTATVSGGSETNTANDTATDATTIDVVPQDFSITAAPALTTVKSGVQADYTITLTPLNNVPFSSAITLTAAGVPANTSILFQPATVTPGTSPATSSFLLRTSADDPFLARNTGIHAAPLLAVGMPLAGILLFGFGFRRKSGLHGKSPLLLLFVFFCMGFALYGCATAGNSFRNIGTPPGTYTITVTGTAGSVTHSTTVTLTVTP